MNLKSRTLPNLTELRAFDALCRCATVTAAANDLGVTPGAISRKVRHLEEALGVQLFTRVGRQLKLTEVGAEFKQDIFLAFDTVEGAVEKVTAAHRSNRLVISCSPSFHFCWLLARLPSFEATHKDITVVVHTQMSTHSKGDVDAQVGVGRWPKDSSLMQTKIMSNFSGPIMARDVYENVAQDAKSAEEMLASVRLIGLREKVEIWQDWYDDAGVTGPASETEAQMDHMFLTIEAVKAGLGAAIAPYGYVADEIEGGSLVAPYGFIERKVPYYIAWPERQAVKSALEKFVTWLKGEGKKTPKPALAAKP